jgi:hypothetical protein
MDSLSRRALVDVANGTRPMPEALDALISALGLPDDLRTAPPEASVASYPSLEELLGSLGITRLLQKVRRADHAELAWAAQSLLNLFRYSLVLYRITLSTGSSGLPVVTDDPEIAASAKHVFRTLIASGRFLDRLMGLSNKRTDIEMAAYNAPVLLVAFDMLPPEARDTFESVMEQVTKSLPRLVAIESLIKDVPAELRHLLSWESQARLATLPADEIEELRSIAHDWGERNPDILTLLRGDTPHGRISPVADPAPRPALSRS